MSWWSYWKGTWIKITLLFRLQLKKRASEWVNERANAKANEHITHILQLSGEIMLAKYEVILLSDIVFKLILCIAMLCIFSLHTRVTESERFLNIFAQSIKKFLEDMWSIFLLSIGSHRIASSFKMHLRCTHRDRVSWSPHRR